MKRIALVVVLAATTAISLATLLLYQPLERGSASGSDEVIFLGVRHESDETIYEYRYAPGGEYFTAVSIRNGGPFPITLTGPDRSVVANMSPSEHALIWADELLLGQTDPRVFFADPRQAESASGSTIGPGAELAVWIHWRMGTSCPPGEPASYEAGSGISTDTVPVSWSVFGVPRTSDLSLGYRFSVANPDEDPLLMCPGP